jgi:hypothetical protein
VEQGKSVKESTAHLIAQVLGVTVSDLLPNASPDARQISAVPSGEPQETRVVDAWCRTPLRQALSNSKSLAQVLQSMFQPAQKCGISHVRFYSCTEVSSEKRLRLVSLESTGYTQEAEQKKSRIAELKARPLPADSDASEEIARLTNDVDKLIDTAVRLRAGYVVQFEPLVSREADSFRCLQKRQPVIFELDPALPEQSKEVFDKGSGKAYFKIREDVCGSLIGQFKSKTWIEFPLEVDDRRIGKLSCDVLAESDPRKAEELFSPLVQVAAPFIDSLCSRERLQFVDDADRIGVLVDRCTTLESLYKWCTNELPEQFFQCRYASILPFSKDSLKNRKLIFRKTSFTPSHDKENLWDYKLDSSEERGLTAWVARNRRSLRLQDLTNPNSANLESQLRGYGAQVSWKSNKPDSSNHQSFLAVPILQNGPTGELLGVIRLTEKHGAIEEKYFTERDQLVLERLAHFSIGPKLVSLQRETVSGLLQKHVKYAREILSCRDPKNLLPIFMRIMRELFPEDLNSKKLYLVNKVLVADQTLQQVLWEGKLAFTSAGDQELKESATDRAVMSPDPVFFINDMKFAVEQRSLKISAVDAVTLLACKGFSIESALYVFVVQSDRYDLVPEVEGQVLANFVQLAKSSLEDPPMVSPPLQ